MGQVHRDLLSRGHVQMEAFLHRRLAPAPTSTDELAALALGALVQLRQDEAVDGRAPDADADVDAEAWVDLWPRRLGPDGPGPR